jgi:hypothetical protein
VIPSLCTSIASASIGIPRLVAHSSLMARSIQAMWNSGSPSRATTRTENSISKAGSRRSQNRPRQ